MDCIWSYFVVATNYHWNTNGRQKIKTNSAYFLRRNERFIRIKKNIPRQLKLPFENRQFSINPTTSKVHVRRRKKRIQPYPPTTPPLSLSHSFSNFSSNRSESCKNLKSARKHGRDNGIGNGQEKRKRSGKKRKGKEKKKGRKEKQRKGRVIIKSNWYPFVCLGE